MLKASVGEEQLSWNIYLLGGGVEGGATGGVMLLPGKHGGSCESECVCVWGGGLRVVVFVKLWLWRCSDDVWFCREVRDGWILDGWWLDAADMVNTQAVTWCRGSCFCRWPELEQTVGSDQAVVKADYGVKRCLCAVFRFRLLVWSFFSSITRAALFCSRLPFPTAQSHLSEHLVSEQQVCSAREDCFLEVGQRVLLPLVQQGDTSVCYWLFVVEERGETDWSFPNCSDGWEAPVQVGEAPVCQSNSYRSSPLRCKETRADHTETKNSFRLFAPHRYFLLQLLWWCPVFHH